MVFGNKQTYEGAIGTSIAKVFDMTVAATGMNETYLNRQNVKFKTSTTHSGSNAGYYPGAMPMSIKINFDPETGQIYGAQIVGYIGIDKRIDQIAILIKHKKTIYDLIQLEHAYAPPFASAKDPIAIAAYVAQNIISNKMPVFYWNDIEKIDFNNSILIDVRTPDEFELGYIKGAINIPVDELRDRIHELPQDKKTYIYCQVGLRGYLATNILIQRGFKDVYNLSGGYKTYISATTPIVNRIGLGEKESRPQEMDIDMQTPRPTKKYITVDACGLQCPGPIMKLKTTMENLETGDRVEVTATDPGFTRDSQSWSNMTGNRVISQSSEEGKYTVVIEKMDKITQVADNSYSTQKDKGKTLIMFSDDLDKALATFVLANGAASTGEKVTIFFTF